MKLEQLAKYTGYAVDWMMNELQFNFQPNQIFLSSPEHPNWLLFCGYIGLVPRD